MQGSLFKSLKCKQLLIANYAVFLLSTAFTKIIIRQTEIWQANTECWLIDWHKVQRRICCATHDNIYVYLSKKI